MLDVGLRCKSKIYLGSLARNGIRGLGCFIAYLQWRYYLGKIAWIYVCILG